MALKYDAFPEDDTVQIDVGGEISEADVDEVSAWLERFLTDRETAHVVEVVEDVEGADPAALWKGLKFDRKHMAKFDRVAVVSDKDWIDPLAKAAEMISGAQVRTFAMAELGAAREWARTGA